MMDELETLFDEQTLETFSTSGTGPVKCIQIAMSDIAGPEGKRAWDTLSESWVRGETRSVVKALCDAQVNMHAFLVRLLKILWTKYLGDDTSVIGTYSALTKFPNRISRNPKPLDLLLRSGYFTKDPDDRGITPDGKFMVQWKDMFNPPAIDKWSRIQVPELPEDTDLRDLVTQAKREGESLDWLIPRAIALYPDGLTHIGQSVEARAYTFCYISRTYRVEFDVLQWDPSSQAVQLRGEVEAAPAIPSAQMQPILTLLTPDSHGRSAPVDLSTVFANRPSAQGKDVLSPLPFWLHMLHRGPTAAVQFFAWSLSAEWTGNKTFFVPLRVQGQKEKEIPFVSIVSWLLLGHLDAKEESRTWGITNGISRAELGCLLSVRLEDIDALLSDNQHFLGQQWREQRENAVKVFIGILLNSHPSQYKRHLKEIIRLVLEFCKTSPDAVPVEPITRLFLQFIALCGDYTQAFVDAMIDADRATSKLIFSGMLHFLSPFPTDIESIELAKLQKTFEEAAYEGPTDLPAHLTDRFVTLVVDLARHQTPITQGLCDAGIIQLLTSIRDGWYKYPDAPDLVPPHVRKLLRERMCEDAFKALSEKMYLASQVRRMYAAVDAPPLPPQEPAPPAPRIRRRPSWMATGG